MSPGWVVERTRTSSLEKPLGWVINIDAGHIEGEVIYIGLDAVGVAAPIEMAIATSDSRRPHSRISLVFALAY